MKTAAKLFILFLTIGGTTAPVMAQGTAFQYQGRLNQNDAPVTGLYDLRFTLFDSSGGSTVVGTSQPKLATGVTNGLFAVTLDFGAGIFTGPARWLEIGVRPAGSASYTNLNPRQPFLPTPYAIHAGSASNVANGSVVKSLNNLRDNVTLAAGPNVTLTSSGSTLTIASAGGGGSGPWVVNGGNTYYNGGNVGIGTTTPANKLTVLTPTLGYGLEHTDGDIRLSTFVGRFTGYLGTLSNHRLTFFANDNGLANMTMTLDTNGRVGVGTDAPTSKFTVVNPGYGIEHHDGNVSLSTFLGGSTGGGWLGTVSNHKLSFFVNNQGARMTIDTTGNVGIGTTTPAALLSIFDVSGGNSSGLNISGLGADGVGMAIQSVGPGGHKWSLVSGGAFIPQIPGIAGNFRIIDETANATRLVITPDGNVGIGGLATPTAKLDVDGDVKATKLILRADPGATANAAVLCADPNVVNFVPYNTATARPLNLVVRDASVRQLTITGGADLAEPFKMSSDEIPKGAVVVIDEQNPGHLKLSTEAYDTRVAGVVSGANGIKPGISLHQEGALEGGENVALSGRVYVQADAAFGVIKPGDLLTTSATAGHAMKVGNPSKAQGAILGKAMTALKEGKGMVLVLVTLQ